jgi:hypothetical protein
MPDIYRPTLYDFIANEALKFYTSPEQAASKAEDAFEIVADKPVYGIALVFGTAEEFLAGRIRRRAEESTLEKAFFLYRDLLIFHYNDKDPTAFIDANIARLQWASNVAFGENKAELYNSALKAVADKWAGHELSAYAHYLRARAIHQEGRWVEARELAQLATKASRIAWARRRPAT